jgi:hypothetical protein
MHEAHHGGLEDSEVSILIFSSFNYLCPRIVLLKSLSKELQLITREDYISVIKAWLLIQ